MSIVIRRQRNKVRREMHRSDALLLNILPAETLGIHSGPVVAGIVGFKEYAYDIWGDTINTAARMESSGEDRGAFEVKGKGLVKMYFVVEEEPTSILYS